MEVPLDTALVAFLAGVVVISLSGVMMPGPVFAMTMAHGQRRPLAGVAISFGHAAVELPLVLLIYVGFGPFFRTEAWRLGVGLLGGLALVLIGLDMLRRRGDLATGTAEGGSGSLAAGLVTTLASPYFFIWWATVGAALVTRAAAWGWAGLAAFFTVHLLCDFGWNLVISTSSFHTRRIWSERAHRWVFAGCGLFLVCFGARFIWGALRPAAAP
jgi:threonine/homoserine/homoserine lactone efflux protein